MGLAFLCRVQYPDYPAGADGRIYCGTAGPFWGRRPENQTLYPGLYPIHRADFGSF